jgi:hypothetical protein
VLPPARGAGWQTRPVRKLALLVALGALLLAGCRVDTALTVHVNEDGSGVVTAAVRLDAGAVTAATSGGAALAKAVRLDDLTQAGWRSTGWRTRKDGSAELRVSKRFARAEDAGAVVAELSGPDGPVRNVKVTRDASTFETEWSFSGVADLKDLKSGIATDQELIQKLAAERVNVAALDQRLVADTKEALRLRVTADLPQSSPKPFPVKPGTTVAMKTSSSRTATGRIALLLVGIAVGLAAVIILVAGERRSRRRGTA